MGTYTKQDVLNMVNAIPEARFAKCVDVDVELYNEPTKFDKVLGASLLLIALSPLLIPACIYAGEGIMHLAKKGDAWWAERKARKAKKAAEIHKQLDEKNVQVPQA